MRKESRTPARVLSLLRWCARRRAHNDVHAPDRLDVVVADLGEDGVFLDAHGEVATAIDESSAAGSARFRQSACFCP